ncbi:hypothetical protein ACQ27_gp357 [Klebsiella phage K64-1]|nr:hypothetical protein ACQ27_gp357 [Klebsiella phage K64-1]
MTNLNDCGTISMYRKTTNFNLRI